jgi:hypothetical protein
MLIIWIAKINDIWLKLFFYIKPGTCLFRNRLAPSLPTGGGKGESEEVSRWFLSLTLNLPTGRGDWSGGLVTVHEGIGLEAV